MGLSGVGGGPWLVQDGTPRTEDIQNCGGLSINSCQAGKAQSAVGITKDNRWLFFVFTPQSSNLNNLATMMAKKLDVDRAIKFDGGGSTELWYNRDNGSKNIISSTRKLSQFLAILANPRNGIPISQKPACPPVNCTYGKDVSRDYFVQVVQNLKGVPMSEFAVDALEAWKPYENPKACWNPLATTWQMGTVCYFNCLKKDSQGNCSIGVQNFQDQVDGVATANTLNLNYYDAILNMLAYEAFDREGLRLALGTWGTCKGAKCDPLLDDWQKLWDANQDVIIPPVIVQLELREGTFHGGINW